MNLTSIRISGYRNLKPLSLAPHPQVNIIFGDNGQGKTNLIEAIFLLTGQKSFRKAVDSELITFGGEVAIIKAEFFGKGRDQESTLAIGKKKKATLNEIEVTPSQFTGEFYSVVFSPTELALVKEGPAARRSFLDSAISQIMPRYSKSLTQFNRILAQRNSLLSDIKYNLANKDMLDVWDVNFAKAAYSIINARSRYIKRIAPKAQEIYSGITQNKESFAVSYLCGVAGYDPDLTQPQIENIIMDKLANARSEDIKNGHTTIGPHRDDLEIMVKDISARSFGSQGQQRSASLTLKLAECSLIDEIMGEKPIVLLDDVFSELDKKRRDYFIKQMGETQVFITSCDQTGIKKLPAGKAFFMKDGVLTEKIDKPKINRPRKPVTGKEIKKKKTES